MNKEKEKEKKMIPRPKTRFLRVRCNCGNEQNIFSAAASKVKCHACNAILAEPGPSKSAVKARITKVLD